MAEERKSIFITGGASGIGQAVARLFAEKGWFVGVVDVNEQKLDAIEKEIGKDNCFIHVLDVTDRGAYNAVISRFGERTSGKLHILYNNAGIGAGGFFEDIPYDWECPVCGVNKSEFVEDDW